MTRTSESQITRLAIAALLALSCGLFGTMMVGCGTSCTGVDVPAMAISVNDVPGEVVLEFRLLNAPENLEGWRNCTEWRSQADEGEAQRCGFDRGGTYEVRGYTTDGEYEGGTTVRVRADECHAKTEEVALTLTAVDE